MRAKSSGIAEARDRMTDKTVLFLHGFASSGQGTKAQFLKEKFARLSQVAFHAFEFNPTPKDFEYMTITGLINRLRQYLLDQQSKKLSLIASSLGALVGLNYVHRFGEGYFHTDGLHYRQPVPPPVPVMIIHGQKDEVIPIAHSRQYVASFPEKTQLIEVDSDHRLNDQLEFIWKQAQLFICN
jgi:pimeloyl-ACP methyl ester carboxylesterase